MNPEAQQIPPRARLALEEFLARIRLARATELAQSERFLEANAVLMLNGEIPDDPRELDLLARIASRQRRFEDARRLWKMAVQKQPENETYRHCLECLTPVRRIAWFIAKSLDMLLNVLLWATIAFGIGVLVFTFFAVR